MKFKHFFIGIKEAVYYQLKTPKGKLFYFTIGFASAHLLINIIKLSSYIK